MFFTVRHTYTTLTFQAPSFCAAPLSYLIFSFFNDSCLLAPKYSDYFTGSALPLLYFLIWFSIGCSAPLYSRSGSLIGSAYLFLYISFCFWINKTLMNLTSLRQHHLQYTSITGSPVQYSHSQLSNGPNKLDCYITKGLKGLTRKNTLAHQLRGKESVMIITPSPNPE